MQILLIFQVYFLFAFCLLYVDCQNSTICQHKGFSTFELLLYNWKYHYKTISKKRMKLNALVNVSCRHFVSKPISTKNPKLVHLWKLQITTLETSTIHLVCLSLNEVERLSLSFFIDFRNSVISWMWQWSVRTNTNIQESLHK